MKGRDWDGCPHLRWCRHDFLNDTFVSFHAASQSCCTVQTPLWLGIHKGVATIVPLFHHLIDAERCIDWLVLNQDGISNDFQVRFLHIGAFVYCPVVLNKCFNHSVVTSMKLLLEIIVLDLNSYLLMFISFMYRILISNTTYVWIRILHCTVHIYWPYSSLFYKSWTSVGVNCTEPQLLSHKQMLISY